jgi:hypothetical protein
MRDETFTVTVNGEPWSRDRVLLAMLTLDDTYRHANSSARVLAARSDLAALTAATVRALNGRSRPRLMSRGGDST